MSEKKEAKKFQDEVKDSLVEEGIRLKAYIHFITEHVTNIIAPTSAQTWNDKWEITFSVRPGRVDEYGKRVKIESKVSFDDAMERAIRELHIERRKRGLTGVMGAEGEGGILDVGTVLGSSSLPGG